LPLRAGQGIFDGHALKERQSLGCCVNRRRLIGRRCQWIIVRDICLIRLPESSWWRDHEEQRGGRGPRQFAACSSTNSRP
jgi:hypothetical protein